MRDWTSIRERFLRDSLPVRLGGLAANLSRINAFSVHEAGQESVANLLDESKLFIEWTAAESEIGVAAELVRLQIQLALWQLNWMQIWNDEGQRKEMARESGVCSQHILEMSGLLENRNAARQDNKGEQDS